MKYILSLDGGGINGLFTLEILARVEAVLKENSGHEDFVLADHFDLIAGTSTGGIIAACLSWGMTVAEIKQLYLDHATAMFQPNQIHRRFRARFRTEGLKQMLRGIFSEESGDPALFGTERLRTLLLLVLRNATTGSPWPLCNNPDAMFNDPSLPDCNLRIPLWQLVRGSTAAPTYFEPEAIEVGPSRFEFIDGGVSPYNNPAHLAFLFATLPCYNLTWETGPEKLHLLSVGTGMTKVSYGKRLAAKMNLAEHAMAVIRTLLVSSNIQQDVLCRTTGRTLFGASIDMEMADLVDACPQHRAAFSYVRYNHSYTPGEVAQAQRISGRTIEMDNLALIPFIMEKGAKYAAENVRKEHVL